MKRVISSVPKKIPPMLARDNPYTDPFSQPNYILQEKLDGTRILAIKNIQGWYLMTRTWKNDVADKFPEIVRELNRIKSNDVVLDGELTYFKNGKPTFVTAIATPETKKGYDIKLMLFDVIRFNGDVTKLPIEKRLSILQKIIPKNTKYIQLIKTITTPSTFKQVYNSIVKNHGEGVIMKEKGTPYVFDSRQHWIKIKKIHTEDCIVLGITNGLGKRKPTFGALILGQYQKDGNMKIVGRTSGFDDTTLIALYNIIMKMPNHTYHGIKDSDAKKWIPPRIVVEVKYFEKTQYGVLRHPVFLRIRDDKLPSQCKVSSNGMIK